MYGFYVIIGILVLIGIKELLHISLWSWNENGGWLTFYWIVLFLSVCNISTSKLWYPQYTENSWWLFYGVILFGILYRLIRVKKRG
jgi:hypothetical protein